MQSKYKDSGARSAPSPEKAGLSPPTLDSDGYSAFPTDSARGEQSALRNRRGSRWAPGSVPFPGPNSTLAMCNMQCAIKIHEDKRNPTYTQRVARRGTGRSLVRSGKCAVSRAKTQQRAFVCNRQLFMQTMLHTKLHTVWYSTVLRGTQQRFSGSCSSIRFFLRGLRKI